MSRKRKINLKDFEHKHVKDVEEKKFFINVGINNDSLVHHNKEMSSEFDIFPACETVIPSSIENIGDKDYMSNIDELSVNNNDLSFINSVSCNYEYSLTENDILSSVSDSTNFYNESVTLYSSNNDNEILFDHSFELTNSNNLESLINNIPYNSIPKCDTLPTVTDTEISSVNDNLENIVPNLYQNTFTNNDINHNNFSFGDESVSLPNEPENESRLNVTSKEPEININCQVNKLVVNPENSVTEDKNSDTLNEFLFFKSSETANNNHRKSKDNNNSNCNNNVFLNSVINVCGNSKENLRILPLKYLKPNIIPPQMLTKQSASISKVIPLQNFVNVKKLNSVNLNFKKSQLLTNEVQKIQCSSNNNNNNNNNNVPLIKYDDYVKSQKKKKLNDVLEKSTIINLGKEDKAVQTNSKCVFYSNLNDNNNMSSLLIRKDNKINKKKDKKSKVFSVRCVDLDRIKKPQPYNKLFLFTFAVNIRTSLNDVLTQEDFINNNEKINYYTGIPQYSYFVALLNCLNLPHNNTISPFQMLLLTLMKIRLNLDWTDLGYRFGRSVQVTKDTFGLTLYILMRCLSRLISWPMEDYDTGIYLPRGGQNLYVYSIKLNSNRCNEKEIDKRIFICLSNSGHPIHFISKPILEEYTNKLDILEFSGIINNLVQKDVIIFDENINCSSMNDDKFSILSVLSKTRDSFCTRPFGSDVENDVIRMKKTVSDIAKYKFLYDNISCEWVDLSSDEFVLFTDVVKVVCGLINLCAVLPFNNWTINRIISERKSLQIMLT